MTLRAKFEYRSCILLIYNNGRNQKRAHIKEVHNSLFPGQLWHFFCLLMYCVCWRNIEVSHIHYPDECQCMSMEQSLQYIRPIWIVFWSGCTYGSLNCGTKLIVIWTVFLTIVFADPSLTLAEIIWLKFKGKNSVLQWCAKEKRSCDSSQACSTSHFQRHFRLSLLALRPTSSS